MNIGLLGCGVVGSEVLRIIDSLNNPTMQITKILDLKPKIDPRFTNNFEEILSDENIDTVVEVMGGLHPAHEFICACLNAKKNVISANKAVIARYFEEFMTLAKENGVSFRLEASVAGGIPWIKELQRVLRMDNIIEFSGILNGTTNYILDELHTQNASFDIVLKDAQMKGYAESDPTSDIEGYDIQNKMCISASIAYKGYVCVDDIPTFGISKIKKEDIDYFKSKGLICKLLGQSKNYGDCISVFVCPVCTTSIEGHVDTNLNITTCVTQNLGTLRMIGQGAGGSPTASAVVSDCIDVFEQVDKPFTFNRSLVVDNTKEDYHFYVRVNKNDFMEDICLSYEEDDTYVYMKTRRMTIVDLFNRIENKNCFVAIW